MVKLETLEVEMKVLGTQNIQILERLDQLQGKNIKSMEKFALTSKNLAAAIGVTLTAAMAGFLAKAGIGGVFDAQINQLKVSLQDVKGEIDNALAAPMENAANAADKAALAFRKQNEIVRQSTVVGGITGGVAGTAAGALYGGRIGGTIGGATGGPIGAVLGTILGTGIGYGIGKGVDYASEQFAESAVRQSMAKGRPTLGILDSISTVANPLGGVFGIPPINNNSTTYNFNGVNINSTPPNEEAQSRSFTTWFLSSILRLGSFSPIGVNY